ncbi:MAG TPA: hypothetical protein VFJ89_15720 [Nocardioides sp.]|nr:hypothetical protein [Nocardioides sp.]
MSAPLVSWLLGTFVLGAVVRRYDAGRAAAASLAGPEASTPRPARAATTDTVSELASAAIRP